MDRLLAAMSAAATLAPSITSIIGLFQPGVSASTGDSARALNVLNAAASIAPAVAGLIPAATKALAGEQLNDAEIDDLAKAADAVDAACEAEVARIRGG